MSIAAADSSRKIRVVIAMYRDDVIAGGSLRVGETLANNLDPAAVEAHLVFAYGGPGPVARSARVPCHFLSASSRFDRAAWLRARALIRKLDPAIVHFMDPIAWLGCALQGRGPFKLLHLHGRFQPSYMTWTNRLLTRSMLSAADALVFISNGARRDTQRLGWGRANAMHTVHNGIDCSLFDVLPPRKAARAKLGLPQHSRVMGMVCRVVRHRGCQDALRILKRLDDDWHLAIVGDGPDRAALEQASHAAGLAQRVHFTGLIDDVRPAFAALDASLFLARYDSFGLATCEAMASGVPVFALEGEGEYTEKEYPLITRENAVCIARNNPLDYEAPESAHVLDQIAERIRDFGDHPGRYDDMVRAARHWVRERFDAPIFAGTMSGLYVNLAG